jgi:hypothetical protein
MHKIQCWQKEHPKRGVVPVTVQKLMLEKQNFPPAHFSSPNSYQCRFDFKKLF